MNLFRQAHRTFPHKKEIPYPLFVEVLTRIIKHILTHLIEKAKVLVFPCLGKLYIKCVKRTSKVKRVDYSKSVRNPDKTLKTIVYYPLSDSYYRFYWQRKPFEYQHLYNFKPTGGSVSNRKTLSDFIKARPDIAKTYQRDPTYLYHKIDPITNLTILYATKEELMNDGYAMANINTACLNGYKHKDFLWKRTPVLK